MKDLRQGIEEFLQTAGVLEFRTLGSTQKPRRQASKEDEARLARALSEARDFQRKIQWLCVVLLCLVFAVQFGFLIYGLVTRNLLSGAAGSVALVLVPTIWRLRRLGMDSVLTEFIRLILRELPPGETAKIIEVAYWGLIRSGGRTLDAQAKDHRE